MVELEELWQEFGGVGLAHGRGGCSFARLNFNAKPPRGATFPSLFSILPCHVDDSDAHTCGEDVCQDELEHHNLSYRLGPGTQ